MISDSNYWTKMLLSFGITNHDHIIVYDHSHLYSACRLWFVLRYFGHKKVSILNGGFQKWLKEKKPVTQKIDRIDKADNYIINENNDWIKNKKQIDENIRSNSFVLVDARSRDRFEGKKEEPRPGLKKGCVPGSKNIPFQNCINVAANTFKSKSELVNIFKENNVDYYKPTVFMCGSGISACVLGLAYFLISDKNAVIYDGSFAEWGKK
jgi:thiosulfate/3-mercaptopyruvate sulfurtransferase